MDGGSNVKSQEIVAADSVVKIQRPKSTEIFLLIFLGLGGLILLLGIAASWYYDTLVGGVFSLLLGGFFGLFAYYSLKRSSPPDSI